MLCWERNKLSGLVSTSVSEHQYAIFHNFQGSFRFSPSPSIFKDLSALLYFLQNGMSKQWFADAWRADASASVTGSVRNELGARVLPDILFSIQYCDFSECFRYFSQVLLRGLNPLWVQLVGKLSG